MKKLITTCVLLAAASFASIAQSKQTATKSAATKNTGSSASATAATKANAQSPQQIAEIRAKMYKQQYQLTDEQYKGVLQAETDYETQSAAFKANGQVMGAGPAAQMKMARDQRFKSVLTPDQYSKYQSSQATQINTN